MIEARTGRVVTEFGLSGTEGACPDEINPATAEGGEQVPKMVATEKLKTKLHPVITSPAR